MRRTGLINSELNRAIGSLRHTDLFAVSDSGLPVPSGVPVIDLGIVYGEPGFLQVLRPMLLETVVEAAWGSEQIATENPSVLRAIEEMVPVELISHDELKGRIADCRFVVRTGEATAFANILMRAGVPWL